MMKRPYISPCYCTNLRRAAGIITEMYDASLSKLGLSAAQYYLLVNLSRLQPVDTTNLANCIGLERSTLVRNMKLLMNKSWIEDVAKGKKHQFKLTELGSNLLSQAKPLWDNMQKELVEQIGQEDAVELMRLLQKIQNLKYNREAL